MTILSALYLKHFALIIFSLLPLISIAIGGQASKFQAIAYIFSFFFGVTGGIVVFVYAGFDGDFIQLIFMGICVIFAVIGYAGLRNSDQ